MIKSATLSVVTCLLLYAGIARSEECQSLVVAGAAEWLPFAYIDRTLEAQGIAYDVVNLIATEMNIPVNIRLDIPWKRIEFEMESGRIDVLAGNYWTENRSKQWLITEEFAQESVHVFTLDKAPFRFDTFQDLKGKLGVIPRGLKLGTEFDTKREELKVTQVSTHEQMHQMLRLGRVDYLISPVFVANVMRSKHISTQLRMLPKPVSTLSIHLSMSKKSACAGIFDSFNNTLKTKLDDGSISNIIAKHIAY